MAASTDVTLLLWTMTSWRRLLPQFVGVLMLVLTCSVGNIAIAQGETAESEQKLADPSKVIMKVYFFRLRAVTEVLIRKQDIERQRGIWFMDHHHPFVTKLRTLLESKRTDQQVAPSSIRLKAEFVREGDIFYMDRFGRVEKNGATNFELSAQEMDSLQADLQNFIGVVDMKARASIP